MSKRALAQPISATSAAEPGLRRWLLFVHQLPAHSSNLRVRTWRRLQQLGALPLKQAVYVLPDTPAAREDFEWLKGEVNDAGGDAAVFGATHLDDWSDDALVLEFRRQRQEAYAALAADAEEALERTAARRTRGTRAPAVQRLLGIFRERLAAIEGIDFFGSAGRDRVIALLAQLEGRTSTNRSRGSTAAASVNPTNYQDRLWVTRPRPGVDRMASAWLIRRFIDPRARFAFAADRARVPEEGVPFDMFGVEFGHHGDGCTFETLTATFGILEPAVGRIAAIVHDLDLKDSRFGAPEAATVSALIEGLQIARADDDELLAEGMTLFDSLYRSFERTARLTGPRPVAPSKDRAGTRKSRPSRKAR